MLFRSSRFEFNLPLKTDFNIGNDINLEFLGNTMENVNNIYGITVLVAEDDRTNYMLLERSLVKEFRANVLHAENGYEAVNLFESTPNIDLVLMDMKMPEMDGYEATRLIRKISTTVPIIAVTAFALIADSEKALEVGCNDYVSKPFDRENLLYKIRLILKDRE